MDHVIQENKALQKKVEKAVDHSHDLEMLKGILFNCARAAIILKKHNLCRAILKDFCKANKFDLTEPPRWSPIYMTTFLRDMIRVQSKDYSNIRGNYRGIRMKLPKKPDRWPLVSNRNIEKACRKVDRDMHRHLENEMLREADSTLKNLGHVRRQGLRASDWAVQGGASGPQYPEHK